MKTTLKAINNYLDTYKANYYPAIQTIAQYAGQLSDAMKDNKIIKLRDKLPAIYIMYIDGNPAAEEPELQYDLLVITQSKILDKNANQNSNLDIADGLVRSIISEPGWEYEDKPYLIDREQVKVRTLMNDDRFDVKLVNLYISNLG